MFLPGACPPKENPGSWGGWGCALSHQPVSREAGGGRETEGPPVAAHVCARFKSWAAAAGGTAWAPAAGAPAAQGPEPPVAAGAEMPRAVRRRAGSAPLPRRSPGPLLRLLLLLLLLLLACCVGAGQGETPSLLSASPPLLPSPLLPATGARARGAGVLAACAD